jgi:uncharacterized protein
MTKGFHARERWHIVSFEKKKIKLNKPTLVVGLPGIGNVGKIALDFLIDELKAKKLYEITSYHFPHTVFVGEDNLVHMPKVEIFYKKGNLKSKKPDLLLMTGDVQPTEQEACYEFCDLILDMFHELDGKEVVTLGGIGLQEVRQTPKVFCTGNHQKIVKRYKAGTKMNPSLFGVVGPVMGVAGLLLGLSQQRHVQAISILAETIAHPLYVGIKGSKEILTVLQKKFALKFDIDKLDREIKEYDKELLRTMQQIGAGQQTDAMGQKKQSHYIG